MGFLDKAKQTLEETRNQFNKGRAGEPEGDPADPADGDAASDPATAQGVGQPQPPAAAEPIEDQPTER
jgi:hypothetical protein